MSVGVINESVGKAMATQVKRVNSDPKALLQKITTLEGTIAAQKDVIVNLRREIQQLRGGAAPAAGTTSVVPPGHISAAEFARRHDVSNSTITRRYNKGKLRGIRIGAYIYISADEVYTKYEQKRAN